MPINTLKSLLNSSIIEYYNDTGGLAKYPLRETDKSATLKTVNLVNVPTDSIFLQLDNIDTATLFIGKKSNGLYENTRCDYLIIEDDNIYFIELKSHENAPVKKKSECIGKFSASLCLIKYVDEVISVVRKQTKIFEHKNIYYILMYQNIPIDKTATSLKPKQSHVVPDKFLSIPVANNGDLYFRELLG
jgi:hypothetical protein